MGVSFDGTLFRGTHVPGPSHNYLGLAVSRTALSNDFPIKECLATPPAERCVTSDEVRVWIVEGLRRANEELGTSYGLDHAEFVISDTNRPDVYVALAHTIIRSAHAQFQTSN